MPRPRTSPRTLGRPHPYYSDRFSQDCPFYRVKAAKKTSRRQPERPFPAFGAFGRPSGAGRSRGGRLSDKPERQGHREPSREGAEAGAGKAGRGGHCTKPGAGRGNAFPEPNLCLRSPKLVSGSQKTTGEPGSLFPAVVFSFPAVVPALPCSRPLLAFREPSRLSEKK